MGRGGGGSSGGLKGLMALGGHQTLDQLESWAILDKQQG